MKPTGSPTFSAPYAMPSWKSLAKWLDTPAFTAEDWARIWELPYPQRRAAIARRVVAKAEVPAVAKPPGCKRCGKPKLEWQAFCGAACSARWEGGDRAAAE